MGGKKEERKKREEERQMARELDADTVDESMLRAAAKLHTKPVIDNGAEELFEKKLSKEEKKELAAKKKAEREAKKAAAAAQAAGDGDEAAAATGTTKAKVKAKQETKAERVQREQAELEAELEEARVKAVRMRNAEGAYLGQIEAPEFSLSNPGGGPVRRRHSNLWLAAIRIAHVHVGDRTCWRRPATHCSGAAHMASSGAMGAGRARC